MAFEFLMQGLSGTGISTGLQPSNLSALLRCRFLKVVELKRGIEAFKDSVVPQPPEIQSISDTIRGSHSVAY
jgi:hypothetical protein